MDVSRGRNGEGGGDQFCCDCDVSAHRARISLRHTLAFPKKGEPARDALEEMLKAGGRWEEVAQLSLALVARRVAEGAWPADLVERVRSFGRPNRTARVTVSKREA